MLRTDKRGAGELLDLPDASMRLGRGWDMQVRIEDDTVSRAHAEVTEDRGHYFITDLGSSNGTFVDDKRITSAALHDGSRVRLGNAVTFRFAIVEEDEREALSSLRERGHFDALTQVYNRRYLSKHLASELAFAERHQAAVSVILIDIDHFKKVNDDHGHLVGDSVLRRVAAIAKTQIRTEDMVARFGGEEFIVVLRQTPVAGAVALAGRIRSAVEKEEFSLQEGGSLKITLSAGCASLACLDQKDADSLIGLADKRLYAAKNQGRNRVVGALPADAKQLQGSGLADAGVEPPSLPEVALVSRVARVGQFARAYEALVPQQQMILGLYYQEECNLGEIAAILEKPEADVTLIFNEGVRLVQEQVVQAGAA